VGDGQLGARLRVECLRGGADRAGLL
jgi:hypothetical protein